MQLRVGTATLRGNLRSYASRFDLLELSSEPGKLPRAAKLRGMKESVPAEFMFNVLLPPRVSALEAGAEVERELAQSLAAAKALAAGFLVLRTEPSVMPSARTRRLLAELVEKLPREHRLAWEPRGLWEVEDAERIAEDLDVVLVRDVSREPAPPGPVLYTRLRALGRSSISQDALERAIVAMEDRELACVVLGGDGAARAAASLRELITELGLGSSDDDDEEELDEDEDDEGDDE